MNTHSAFVQISPNSHAFIDGIPDACGHKEEDSVYQAASGKIIYWHTYRQWAGFTSQMRDRLIHNYHESIDDPIVMGTSQCRKCKRIFHPGHF